MRLPRDLSGENLARLLRRHYGYQLTRQKGSHMTLTRVDQGAEHNVTIPRHRNVHIGTLSAIISDVADYLERTRDEILREIFGS